LPTCARVARCTIACTWCRWAQGQAGGPQLWENGNYSSCNFPQLIAEYYGYLKQDTESAPDDPTRRPAARPTAAAVSA
jgi:hypothetical protein